VNEDKPRNKRRTWQVDLYAGWGDGDSATVYLGRCTVTLSADHTGTLSAQVDGHAETVEEAVRLLNWAKRDGRVRLLEETRTPQPEALNTALTETVIGKSRAALLHRIMGSLGLPSAQHYALAAAALGEWAPVPSLADLYEREARVVWAHLCRLYPSAPIVAARVTARTVARAA
jgi:hypothetical protein